MKEIEEDIRKEFSCSWTEGMIRTKENIPIRGMGQWTEQMLFKRINWQ
jgi:hypothetical protein